MAIVFENVNGNGQIYIVVFVLVSVDTCNIPLNNRFGIDASGMSINNILYGILNYCQYLILLTNSNTPPQIYLSDVVNMATKLKYNWHKVVYMTHCYMFILDDHQWTQEVATHCFPCSIHNRDKVQLFILWPLQLSYHKQDVTQSQHLLLNHANLLV